MAIVFQYGSNCLNSQMNGDDRLRGDARFLDIAETVEDFELAFDVWSQNRSCAASNIVRKPGNKVWGVLYEVPDDLLSRDPAKARGRKSLDQIEGESTNYKRETIKVRQPNGEIVTAWTYTVRSPQPSLKTNLTYVGYIVAGLREHGVNERYIDGVKAIAIANNPAIAAEVGAL